MDLSKHRVAPEKAGSGAGNATVDAFDETTPQNCGNYDSDDCVSEYNNAVNNNDLDAFYHRCATRKGERIRSASAVRSAVFAVSARFRLRKLALRRRDAPRPSDSRYKTTPTPRTGPRRAAIRSVEM